MSDMLISHTQLAAVKAKQPNSLTPLYRAYHQDLKGTIFAWLGGYKAGGKEVGGILQQADIMATEIFVKFYLLSQNFDTPENARAFLYITAKDNGLDCRQNGRIPIPDVTVPSDVEQAAEQEWRELAMAIISLPETAQEQFRQSFFEQKKRQYINKQVA
jgi:DNA-directed RNA polymerase specialized sigma24 family protein